MPAKVVHLNGRLVEPAKAMVSLLDPGYLLGVGVFATMRADDGVCFRPEAHLALLGQGASALDLPVPDDLVRIADEVARLVGGLARVRVTLSATACSVIGEEMQVPPADDRARGVAIVSIGPRRAADEGAFKSTSYARQVMARADATRRGAAEGLQLASDGAVSGATMANVFVRTGRVLATPSLASGCRPGITRAAVMELAPYFGLGVEERRIERAELLGSDEVFLTSTRVGCLPVRSLDDEPVGTGEMASALHDALEALIARERVVRCRGDAHSP